MHQESLLTHREFLLNTTLKQLGELLTENKYKVGNYTIDISRHIKADVIVGKAKYDDTLPIRITSGKFVNYEFLVPITHISKYNKFSKPRNYNKG